MKVTKYGVATIFNDREVDKQWYPTKHDAIKRLRYGASRKYVGTKEVDLYCASCDKDLKPGDKYIKQDEDLRYCEDCYEANTFTYYTVGGEPVGNENEIEEYDDYDLEAVMEADNETKRIN